MGEIKYLRKLVSGYDPMRKKNEKAQKTNNKNEKYFSKII